jgi:hypothetical protein
MAEVAEEKIRPVTYIIGAIAVIIVLLFVGYLALFTTGGSWWDFTAGDVWTRNWNLEFCMVFLLPLILSVIAAVIGPKVRKGELVIICAMVAITWTFTTYPGIIWTTTMLGTARALSGSYGTWTMGYGAVHNWIFGPDPNVAANWNSWMYGGPVDWNAWLPSRMVSIATVLPLLLSYVFLSSLWRRMWIDIEALPYPFATANSTIINMAYEKTEKGTPRIFTNAYLWIGLVIGFLLMFPYWGPVLVPGIYATKLSNTFWYPVNSLSQTSLDASFGLPNTALNFNLQPWYVAAGFLVPSTTLLSYIVGTLITGYLLAALPVWIGAWEAYSSPGDVSTLWRGYTGPMMQAWTNQWGARAFMAIGAMIGLVYFPLVIHRTEVLDSLKSIFGKGSPEVEKREPMKYRYLWLGYIICVLWYVFMWDYRAGGGSSLGNLNWLAGIIWVVATGWMYMIGQARLEAEMGLVCSPVNCNMFAHNWNEGIKSWLFADQTSPFFINDLKQRYLVQSSDVSWFDQTFRVAPFTYLLHYFKIGSLNGVRSKHIFIGAIIAVIVAVIVVPFASLQFWCMFGATRLKEFAYSGSPANYFQRGPTYSCLTLVGDYYRGGTIAKPIPQEWIQAAIAAVAISCIYIVRARFAWFPLNAAGVALGFMWCVDYFLWAAIVAYILKLIVLRVGGLKLYQEKAMPLAIGVAVADGVAVLICNIYTSTLPH